MGVSIFLAKFLGLYFLIAGLLMLVKYESLREAVDDFVKSPGLLLLAGFFTLMFGILLILFHNIWVMEWPIVITILAWIIFFQGIVRLFFADKVSEMIKSFQERGNYKIMGILMSLIGLFLLYHGFF